MRAPVLCHASGARLTPRAAFVAQGMRLMSSSFNLLAKSAAGTKTPEDARRQWLDSLKHAGDALDILVADLQNLTSGARVSSAAGDRFTQLMADMDTAYLALITHVSSARGLDATRSDIAGAIRGAIGNANKQVVHSDTRPAYSGPGGLPATATELAAHVEQQFQAAWGGVKQVIENFPDTYGFDKTDDLSTMKQRMQRKFHRLFGERTRDYVVNRLKHLAADLDGVVPPKP